MRCSTQCFHAITRLELCGLTKAFHNVHHRFPVEHAGDVVGNGRCGLPAPARWQVCEERCDDLTGDISEGIAVEKEERGAPVAMPEKLYEFGEGEDLILLLRPLCSARFLSLSIKAVLRASSCARSSVEADDKLPTPVFEKLGSGL